MLAEPIAPTVDTILIVDDDTARAARIGQALSLHGYGVLHACGDHAAVDLAREHRPPLVLLSVTTPGGEPADLCRRLRSDWRCGSPSIIILAGRADAGEFASALATAADDYVILEPFDAVRVLTRVGATLRRAEEMRGSSPLTGLPGNSAIETELQRRAIAGEPMALLYIDLDNFKAYNDHYGFLRGDAVIRGVADVLRAVAEKRPGTFLGHVGGDDFVVVSAPEDAEGIANEIISGVEKRAPIFYDPDDAARGVIEVEDRQGVPRQYPLVTVSIGVARALEGQVCDHRALVDAATEMKQYAKTKQGNAFEVDRRRDDDRGPVSCLRLHRGSPVARLRRNRPRRRRAHGETRMGWAAIVLLPALLLALTIPTATAFAANATPGNPLWSAKLKLEAVQLTLATSTLRETMLHLEFASNRLTELAGLLETRDPAPRLIEVVQRNFQAHMEKAAEGLERLKARGDADGPQAAQVESKVVIIDALSKTVSAQCGTPPASAAHACRQIQPALTTTVNDIRMVVPPTPAGPLIALGPQPPPAPPPDDGSVPPPRSNTTDTTSAQTGQSPDQGVESGKPASKSPPASNGEATAPSSAKASPQPAPSPSPTEIPTSPEPTPTDGTTAPTEPPPSDMPTESQTGQGPEEQQSAPPGPEMPTEPSGRAGQAHVGTPRQADHGRSAVERSREARGGR